MRNVTIKRGRWLRGEGSEDSYLLRGTDNKMCCLGYVARAARVTAHDIFHVRTPDGLIRATRRRGWFRDLFLDSALFDNSELTNTLMEINDSQTISDLEREVYLGLAFAGLGINVRFVD